MKSPPKWADRFLEWYCHPDLLEEIQGDLHELYDYRFVKEGQKKARWKFVWDVIRFFRWSNIKRSKIKLNNNMMFSNYFKTGIRNLWKEKLVSSINIAGLSLSIGVAITVYIFVSFFLSLDNFHKDHDRIYQLVNHVETGDEVKMHGDIPLLFGPELKENIPAIEYATRIEYNSGNVRYEDEIFEERVWYTDPDFLEIFSFDLKYGNSQVLEDKTKIVVSEAIAKKYFGSNDPIDKQVSIKWQNGLLQTFTIGGVFEKFEYNNSFSPSILISIENFFDSNFQENYDYKYLTDGLFVKLKSGALPQDVSPYFNELITKQNQSDLDFQTKKLELIELMKLSEMGFLIEGAISNGSHPAGRLALAVVAVLLVLLACFNYVNIAVASSTKRLKEIALRKVLGSNRSGIVRQFLVENIITAFIALLIGLLLAYFAFLPGFNKLLPIYIPFSFSSIASAALLFTGILLVVGLVAGAYPAFYISKFEPVSIFKGKQKFGSKSFFSKVLLGFQLIIAITTIVGAFIFTDTAVYYANKDWGYNPEGIITIPVNSEVQYRNLEDNLNNEAYVASVSGSKGQVGFSHPVSTIRQGEKVIQSTHFKTNYNYQEVMGLKIKQGRFFNQNSDKNKAVVNERFTNKMDWNNPLEEFFYIDSVRYDVVGVVEDYVSNNYWEEISPAIFTQSSNDNYDYLLVKSNDNDIVSTYISIEHIWKDIAPFDPFEAKFQGEALDQFFRSNKSNIMILGFISTVALILACSGLYGLVSFNIARRMKELSVRKILGAKLDHITFQITRGYIYVLAIALLIGLPLGWFAMNNLIKAIYPEQAAISGVSFILAVVLIVLSIAVTISIQVFKLGKNDPAKTLNNE